MQTACPSEELLYRWLDASLAVGEAEPVARHVETCSSCRTVTSALLRVEGPQAVETSRAGWTPTPGVRVGPFVLLERVGQGAMGEVFAAWDSRLERRAAVKWVRGAGDEASERRLWDEAQTLARLAHPNVVRVLDAGRHEARTWLAMEWVSGCTLRQYLLARPRWRETLAVLLQAGRGLAEAHRAGVVHRDVKPENILVDSAGLARVSDFGLAAVRTEEPVIAGTVAYMAPEQLEGIASSKGDQFSFAVVVWEALFGIRPIDADTAATRREALEGPLRRGPWKAPASVRVVLRRALSARPEDRFESMEALLAALHSAAHRSRRLLVGAAALALAVGLAANVGWAWWQGHRCDGRTPFAAVWTPARRSGVATREALVRPFLTQFEGVWVDTWGQVCRATRDLHAQTETRMTQRLECLSRRRDALGRVLDQATVNLEDRAVLQALQDIDPPADCARIEPAADVRSETPGEDQMALERVETALGLGQLDQVRGELDQLLSHRTRLADEGLLADVLMVDVREGAARGLDNLERSADLEKRAGAALAQAVMEADDEVAFAALLQLAERAALDRNDLNEAHRRFTEAEAYMARLGASTRHELALLTRRSMVFELEGDGSAATRDAERALDLAEHEVPVSDVQVLSAFLVLVSARYADHDFEVGLPLAERTAALAERIRGPDHFDTEEALHHLARFQALQGQWDRAVANYERIIALQKAHGRNAEGLGTTLLDLSVLETDRGHHARGIELAREGLERLRETKFENAIASAEDSVSRALQADGQLAEAERFARTAKDRMERYAGVGTREAYLANQQLCAVLLEEKHSDEAEACFREARRNDVRNYGEDSAVVTLDDRSLGLILEDRHQYVAALALQQSVRARLDKDSHANVAIDSDLARTHLALGHFEEAARLAQKALDEQEGALLPNILATLAEAEFALGRTESAAAHVQQALPLLGPGPFHQALRQRLLRLGPAHAH